VFTTAPFLRPLSGQAYKQAGVTFSPRAARPSDWRGWRWPRPTLWAGGQRRNQVGSTGWGW